MEKKKTKVELLAERSANLEQRKSIIEACTKENRNLTAEEVAKLEEIRSANALIEAELDAIEEQRKKEEEEVRAKGAKVTVDRSEQLHMTRLLRGIATGKMDDDLQAVFAQGAEELRKAGVSDATGFAVPTESRATLTSVDGAKLIQTEKKGILAPLMQSLIFSRLGANVATGLTGNAEFVKGTSFQAQWKGENAKFTDEKLDFTTIEFKPKRLGITVPISMQLLMQDSLGVEAYVRKMINLAIQNKLESTAFGTEAAGEAHRGMFEGTVANKGAMSYDRSIGFISTLDAADALLGTPKFVTSPVGFASCAKTPFSADKALGYLTDYRDKNVLGYEVLTTSAVSDKVNTNESGIVFGNWADFFVGQWGSLVFTADNITRAREGIVEFTINSWWDFGWVRDESRVIASISAPVGK